MNLEKNHIELKKILIKNLTKSNHANLINIHLLNNKSKLKGVELFNVNHNFNPNIINLISSYLECQYSFDIIKQYCNLNFNSEISIKNNYFNLEQTNNINLNDDLHYNIYDNSQKITNYETTNLNNLIQDNLLITYDQHKINSSNILKKNCDINYFLIYEWSLDNLIKLKLTIYLDNIESNVNNNNNTKNILNDHNKFNIKLIIKKNSYQILNNIQINKIFNYLIKLNKLISYLDIK